MRPSPERSRAALLHAFGSSGRTVVRFIALGLFVWLPAANAALTFTSEPPDTAEVGVRYTYTMTAQLDNDDDNSGSGGDGDGGDDLLDVIEFVAQTLPGWLAFDDVATISGTPSPENVGSHTVVVLALAGSETVTQSFSITVSAAPTPNAAPVFLGAPLHSVGEGENVDIDIAAYFSDDDPLTFDANGMPGWLSLDGSRVSGVAPNDGGSTVSFVVIASDGDLETPGEISIAIVAGNDPPEVVEPIEPDPQHAFVDQSYGFDAGPFFSDPNGDALTFSASGLPASFGIASDGRITGTPTADDAAASPFSVTVRAADPDGDSASATFTLIVEAQNGPPVLDRPIAPDPQSVGAGEPYHFDVSGFFSDPDGDPLSFAADGLPGSVSIDPSGIIAGTPSDADEGTHSIRVTASDGTASASGQYSLTVVVADSPPVLPDPPPALSTPEDTPIEITPERLNAQDDEPSALTVVLTPPSGDANFTLADGGTVVVPERDFNGTLTVEASVKDASSTSNRVTVTITVTPVNDAPRIDAVPQQSASEGAPFELRLGDAVSDPEGDPITFAATGLPPGLAIDPSTGTIAGVPTIGAAVGAHAVQVTASDGDASSSADFELRVTATGHADLSVTAAVAPNPALSASPATFTFTITNASTADVGRAALEVRFTADAPFSIDAVSDPSCLLEGGSGAFVLRCTFTPLAAGDARTVEATGGAQQAAEILADASVMIADDVPIDEMADNDAATVTLVVARSLGAGAAQELDAPGVGAVAIGDLDGDGIDDLAAVGASQPVFVFLNRPSGKGDRVTFGPDALVVGEPFDAVDVAAADLDGDGDVDLVAADGGGAHRLLLNDGAAGFESSLLIGGASAAVEIADLDGDALPDIAFAGPGAGANAVFRNAGGGVFSAVGTVLDGPAADVIATEVLGGAPPELVFVRGAGNAAVVSSAAGAAQAFELATGAATSVAAADFDGDGREDLVLGDAPAAGQPDAVFLNTSGGSPSFFRAEELSQAPAAALLTGDFDIDGATDVVAINAAGGHRLYRNSGAANLAFVLHDEQFSTGSAAGAASGDLNGDGRPDVAVAAADLVAVFLNDGHGNLGRGDETAPTLSLVGEPTISVTIGDSYADPGATASDDVDGDLSDRIIVDDPVDVGVIGTYTVTYDVTDLSGNPAPTLTRAVEVRAREAGGGGGGGATGLATLLSLCAALCVGRACDRRSPHRIRAPEHKRTPGNGP